MSRVDIARKQCKSWFDFEFPQKKPLNQHLRDVLIDAPEKYYVKPEKLVSFAPQDVDTSDSIEVIGRLSTFNGNDICKRVYSVNGVAPTLPTGASGNTMPKIWINGRVRKLMPEENFRLMGFTDEDSALLREHGYSDAVMYRMAGNSIVVNVMQGIFRRLLCEYCDNAGSDDEPCSFCGVNVEPNTLLCPQ